MKRSPRVFGAPEARLMCFFHVIKNVDNYLRLIKKKFHAKLKENILMIVLLPNWSECAAVGLLFSTMWS